jgi:redox-sensing transcriptional repressor
MKLPEKTLQRLIEYKHVLSEYVFLRNPHIFSHDLARILEIHPSHVRRDLMLIGAEGSFKDGYQVGKLLEKINQSTCLDRVYKVCIITQNSDPASFSFYEKILNEQENFIITAFFCFNQAPSLSTDVPVFPVSSLKNIVEKENITLCIIDLYEESAVDVVQLLADTSIQAILNLSPVRIHVPTNIVVKNINLYAELEMLAYRTSVRSDR